MSDSSSLSFICRDEKYKGFDLQAGKTWIYPTNYPLRDYQFNIIQEALMKNTLVSLPTGLGKTFIAAVVMYNFYRWYPSGKIIFMAPTRPLVKQQIDACYNIMAIPKETTAELTGSNMQATRDDVWKDKRVFFVTAQVLSNDLDRIADLGPKIKCLVFDEAHRAKGNYAYCLVIRKLLPKTKYFRVLALSATPGNNISDVEEVVENLLISHIELRTEVSSDVVPYTFRKNMETIVVPIGGKLTEIRDRYIQILEKYTRVLLKHRVIHGNCSNLTKGKIFMTLKDFQEKNRTSRCESYQEIMRNLNICITLYHGFELLIRHGLRGFLSFFQEHAEKPLLRGNTELFSIMQDVSDYLGPSPDISPLPDGTTPEIPENTRFGHPKFYKLCDILLSHFTEHHNQSSRVIVFCEYRESVMEAYTLLLQQKPLIRPKVFIGQGAITQRQQLNVIQAFVEGDCNTLISTCIGEEGLDVGEVDLIVCFDISNKSPVRMIQRIGRTGRKRDGRVVILVTEGREEQTLKACLIQKHYMSKTILGSTELAQKLYKENSRMMPDDIVPECMKINIVVKKETKIKNETIKGMFNRMENNLTQGSSKREMKDRIPNLVQYWNKENPLQQNNQNENKINFSKYLEKQRKLQPTGIINHTKQSDLLVSLLQFADSKRFNIPVTQGPSLFSQFSQAPKEKSKTQKSGGYKQSDLRSMLFKTSSNTTQTTSEESVINKKVSDYLQSLARQPDVCKICENLFDCTQLQFKDDVLKISEWIVPDIKILDCINNNSLENFKKSLDPFAEDIPDVPEPDDDCSENNSIAFELPRGFDDVLKKCDSTFNFTPPEKRVCETERFEEILKFFKLNSLEDLIKPVVKEMKITPPESIHLDETIIYVPDQDEDFIENSTEEKLSPVLNKTQKQRDEDGSPILCSYERIKFLKDRAQRKLFTGEKSFSCEIDQATQVNAKPKLSNLMQKNQKSFCVSKDKNMEAKSLPSQQPKEKAISDVFDTTFFEKPDFAKIDDIDDIFDTSFFNQNSNKEISSKSQETKPSEADVLADISDICDLSIFKKTTVSPKNNLKNCTASQNKSNDDLFDIADICDISALISNDKSKVESNKADVDKKNASDINDLLDLDDICDISLFKPSTSTSNLQNKKEQATKLGSESQKMTLKTQDIPKTNQVALEIQDKSFIESKRRSRSPVLSKSKDVNLKRDSKKIKTTVDHRMKASQMKHEATEIDATESKNENESQKNIFKAQDRLELAVQNKSVVKSKRGRQSPVFAKPRDINLNRESRSVRKTDSSSTKTQKACSNALVAKKINKTSKHTTFSQESLADFEESFLSKTISKTPKKLRLNETAKTKSIDSNVKKCEPKGLCESTSSATKTSTSQQSQLSITQILNIVNGDDKKASKSNFQTTTQKRESDSEDDFDLNSTIIKNRHKSTLSLKSDKNKNTKNKLIFESDDDFEMPAIPKSKNRNVLKSNKKPEKSKKRDNPFIELEAEVSEEEGVIVSDDESIIDGDCLDSSFVNDESQVFNNTQMHAHYLQSVRSPKTNKGFKIPKLPKLNNSEVFSQPVPDTEDTYLNDTFCVGSQGLTQQDTEPCELEIAEMNLQQEKKRKRQQKHEKNRKRRILRISDDSDSE